MSTEPEATDSNDLAAAVRDHDWRQIGQPFNRANPQALAYQCGVGGWPIESLETRKQHLKARNVIDADQS